MRGFRGLAARQAGFTLVELIVALAVLAILTTIAIPSLREMQTNMATSDNTNQLVGALNLARSEAVKRGRAAAVLAIGGSWDSGWQVVVAKTDASGSIEQVPISPGNTASACAGLLENDVPLCLHHRSAMTAGFSVVGKATGGSNNGAVVFSPTGALRGATGFELSVCRPSDQADASRSRRITIQTSGTIQSHRGASNCS